MRRVLFPPMSNEQAVERVCAAETLLFPELEEHPPAAPFNQEFDPGTLLLRHFNHTHRLLCLVLCKLRVERASGAVDPPEAQRLAEWCVEFMRARETKMQRDAAVVDGYARSAERLVGSITEAVGDIDAQIETMSGEDVAYTNYVNAFASGDEEGPSPIVGGVHLGRAIVETERFIGALRERAGTSSGLDGCVVDLERRRMETLYGRRSARRGATNRHRSEATQKEVKSHGVKFDWSELARTSARLKVTVDDMWSAMELWKHDAGDRGAQVYSEATGSCVVSIGKVESGATLSCKALWCKDREAGKGRAMVASVSGTRRVRSAAEALASVVGRVGRWRASRTTHGKSHNGAVEYGCRILEDMAWILGVAGSQAGTAEPAGCRMTQAAPAQPKRSRPQAKGALGKATEYLVSAFDLAQDLFEECHGHTKRIRAALYRCGEHAVPVQQVLDDAELDERDVVLSRSTPLCARRMSVPCPVGSLAFKLRINVRSKKTRTVGATDGAHLAAMVRKEELQCSTPIRVTSHGVAPGIRKRKRTSGDDAADCGKDAATMVDGMVAAQSESRYKPRETFSVGRLLPSASHFPRCAVPTTASYFAREVESPFHSATDTPRTPLVSAAGASPADEVETLRLQRRGKHSECAVYEVVTRAAFAWLYEHTTEAFGCGMLQFGEGDWSGVRRLTNLLNGCSTGSEEWYLPSDDAAPPDVLLSEDAGGTGELETRNAYGWVACRVGADRGSSVYLMAPGQVTWSAAEANRTGTMVHELRAVGSEVQEALDAMYSELQGHVIEVWHVTDAEVRYISDGDKSGALTHSWIDLTDRLALTDWRAPEALRKIATEERRRLEGLGAGRNAKEFASKVILYVRAGTIHTIREDSTRFRAAVALSHIGEVVGARCATPTTRPTAKWFDTMTKADYSSVWEAAMASYRKLLEPTGGIDTVTAELTTAGGPEASARVSGLLDLWHIAHLQPTWWCVPPVVVPPGVPSSFMASSSGLLNQRVVTSRSDGPGGVLHGTVSGVLDVIESAPKKQLRHTAMGWISANGVTHAVCHVKSNPTAADPVVGNLALGHDAWVGGLDTFTNGVIKLDPYHRMCDHGAGYRLPQHVVTENGGLPVMQYHSMPTGTSPIWQATRVPGPPVNMDSTVLVREEQTGKLHLVPARRLAIRRS